MRDNVYGTKIDVPYDVTVFLQHQWNFKKNSAPYIFYFKVDKKKLRIDNSSI